MNKWVKLLKDLRDVYGEIYDLERKRIEINKIISVKKKRMNALLNYLRMEGKDGDLENKNKMRLLRSRIL